MDVGFGEEQEEIRKALRDALDKHGDSAAVRAAAESADGYDTRVWRRLCDQTGLPGLGIPERYGGVGLGFTEVAIACEEMGRALYPSPFLATCVRAATALLRSGDAEACERHVPGIAAGTLRAALAGPTGEVTAVPSSDGGHRLTGTADHVIDGARADVILVAARLGGAPALFAVDADATGLTRRQLPVLDPTRRQARLAFTATPARLVGTPGAAALLDRIREFTEIAVAAECVGGAARCLDMTVDYVKLRRQFGRQIGSFQAVKHRCADMYVQLETARSALHHTLRTAAAAESSGPGAEELRVMAPLAMTTATDTYRWIAEETIQLHGGIGFTWEHDAHLHLKRATTSALLFGPRTAQRERIAASAGI
ncbi:acyl-CoA/acyl-ACP dehydrogenase [Yinghuangia sp. ASG 101]|uniref:acyl-CoA dehydrogenase family protein n=1 Tax=Yinghuangia sp. ASG 101 TaxID=2896848 RepID=UPI001E43EEC3|nr:acyl-CoA dehydrogenase family protein [Yinghuangia sp. ASG 101]UGQ09267.1 acyl-CoA/acyl-ACP dehydrogenase [Yinghuangia sp. ASG 101]